MPIDNCKLIGVCQETIGPEQSDANLSNQDRSALSSSFTCVPVGTPGCNPAALTERKQDSTFINSVVNEALNLGGADVHVFKMLGVHEQYKLVDATGQGRAMSSGDTPNFPASNAYDAFLTEWRSLQRGQVAITTSAFIGYDFGEIKNSGGFNVYSVEAGYRKHVTALAIKQSANHNNRVTRVRVERSADGQKWYGVQIVDLPDDSCLVTVMLNDSVPMRYWRLRPLNFNGGMTDYWGVQAIQMFHNFQATALNNIQDKILMENRNRDYSKDFLLLKGYYDPQEPQTELSKFGIDFGSISYTITVGFSACVQVLGRPVVIGDIIRLPAETQYSQTMQPIERFLEVTDVSWSAQGFAPTWKHTLLRVIAQPIYATEETQDIFGDLAPKMDSTGLLDKDDGNSTLWQDYMDIKQTIVEHAKDRVPELGATVSDTIRQFSAEEEAQSLADGLYVEIPNHGPDSKRVKKSYISKVGAAPNSLYVEDALPPNSAPYTEANEFPQHPKDGDYHRLTYTGLDEKYPARLYRWSGVKNRWIFLEVDRREQFSLTRELISEFKMSPSARNPAKITNKRKDLDDK